MKHFDLCVYGGTSAGVTAAVEAARRGLRIALVEPGRHLGGMSSGGLGCTDFGNRDVIGGLSREFYARLGRHYGQPLSWTFEPHVAERVFEDFVSEHDIIVLRNHRVVGVEKTAGRIERIVFEHVPTDEINAPVAAPATARRVPLIARAFIDTSYEGDLMARAGVGFTVGREAQAQYGEPHNGVRHETLQHQFAVPVDPYVVPGDAASGLLPLISPGSGGTPGAGDRLVQAYNFRLCLTRNSANQHPIEPPDRYDPKRFELLARYLCAMARRQRPLRLHRLVMAISPMPGGKTDINNSNAFSTDFIGGSWAYPDADYAARGRIWHEHLDYTRGLLHFLATSTEIPEELNAEMATWQLCRDEFEDTGGWPHQLYVREARRMVGPVVLTEADCQPPYDSNDAVGMAAYTMDSHNCQRIVQHGVVRNEGDVQVRPAQPYPVSYRAITPHPQQCQNLLVPVCLSASHIAFGSIRMEPVFMVLGQSAAVAACLSLETNCAVQAVPRDSLRDQLLGVGQVLEYDPTGKPVLCGNPELQPI